MSSAPSTANTAVALLVFAACCRAAVPTPASHFGYTPGDDYKLADTSEIFAYFHKLAAASDRIRLEEFGRSTEGRPMYVAFISAPENLRKLDRLRQINARLALGQPAADEARALAEEGRAVVWIDSGLHASEVAPAQQAPLLAYKMLTDDSAEVEAVRRNVILMQVPVINPDGLDMVAHWYRRNVGTPFETAPMPWLFQKYAGHDNNRDWFMLNLAETRNVSRLLFREWFPHIVYNQHQAPPFPARIFVPPYAEPLNPDIPAAVMEGINQLGAAMRERFAREGKPGVLSYFGFDAWWNGGLRSAPAFHNMHGILTETAGYAYATPRTYAASDLPAAFGNGTATREPSIFYESPWMGGRWGLRDAIEYMLTADMALLTEAATHRAAYLFESYRLARQAIAAGAEGKPYAYVIAGQQSDWPTTWDFLDRLAMAGIEVQRARTEFQAQGKSYEAGTLVIPASQPFRPYLIDLLEPQHYPNLKEKPYDITGWTLPMQMGVRVDRIDERFDVPLEPVTEFHAQGSVTGEGPVLLLDHRENDSFLATSFFMDREGAVRWAADGTVEVDSAYTENAARADNFARQFRVSVTLARTAPRPVYELRRPRVGLYQPWTPNSDEGWTEWLLDRYHVPYTLLHNDDIRQAELRARFDSLILASQPAQSILNGWRNGELSFRREGGQAQVLVQRPEYTGGIGPQGVAQLEKFVRAGGTLIALNSAADLPREWFPLPLLNVGGAPFSCPGSLVRITVDAGQPLAFGMAKDAIALVTGGEAFDVSLAPEYNRGDREVRVAARFAAKDLLASGYVSGEKAVLGKAALVDARFGAGHVVLFAFRPQFRGQPFGTFKFLLNAVYLASARSM
ncbi:MAG TPA: M14 metallopeptidase family protein [Bryobacteraceae bacterium]|nr:M14 metallopeptidase family protein [Bryobacteraceae bacterium]